tara:strand:+ start:3007 stop:4524 length:1518 start_codon:yes stop_codon:yes gene_type:complete
MNKDLQHFKKVEKELSLLEGMLALLQWDRATIMPESAIEQRAEQSSIISEMLYTKTISKEFRAVISKLAKKSTFSRLDKADQLSVSKYKKQIAKEKKIPLSFVKEYSELVTKANAAWENAKEKNKFSLFKPYLEKIIAMQQKEAKIINPKLHPYDFLLDEFEEGMNIAKLNKVFEKLKVGLIEILTNIKSSAVYKKQKNHLVGRLFPIEGQERVTGQIKDLILDNHTRNLMAESVHPFTTAINGDDVRITTAYDEKDPMFSFKAVAHESGHALYELGFSKKLQYTIMAKAPSIGLHESQSRFWENFITKSKAFWSYYYPTYKKIFSKQLSSMNLNEFYKQANFVQPSNIRVLADEVTYCLHIIIRFELERELMENSLKVKDLPKAWNKKYKEYLGIVPQNDKVGVLQDTHWSMGLIGYFPTYAIGTMYAASIYYQIRKELPGINQQISKGNVKPIRNWLHKNIHQYGSTMLAHDIIAKSCGKELDSEDLIKYLKDKYYGIYGVKN